MKFGYARVSTDAQELASQLDALEAAGCDEILSEFVSGLAAIRPELDRRLDRLGRSMSHLVGLVDRFASEGVQLGLSD